MRFVVGSIRHIARFLMPQSIERSIFNKETSYFLSNGDLSGEEDPE
jgi:hypothetical protein